jgi:hypothetical protein
MLKEIYRPGRRSSGSSPFRLFVISRVTFSQFASGFQSINVQTIYLETLFLAAEAFMFAKMSGIEYDRSYQLVRNYRMYQDGGRPLAVLIKER